LFAIFSDSLAVSGPADGLDLLIVVYSFLLNGPAAPPASSPKYSKPLNKNLGKGTSIVAGDCEIQLAIFLLK